MGTTDVPSATMAVQVRLNRVTPSHCRVVLDNPPLNLMGPAFVSQIREIVTALENDDRVKVVVFESAVDGFYTGSGHVIAYPRTGQARQPFAVCFHARPLTGSPTALNFRDLRLISGDSTGRW